MAIHRYSDEFAERWDAFVLDSSVNGNFLQTRQFLSYHPDDRFKDYSLMYFDARGSLRAVIPAAIHEVCDKEILISHPGSTYGGIVFDAKSCTAKRFQQIISELLDYARSNGFCSVDLRFPPDFLWKRGALLSEYMLVLNGFTEQIELTTFVDFSNYKDSILSNFAQGKRTNINNGKKRGLQCRELVTDEEMRIFYSMLCDNLLKYDAKPVHTLEELMRLHRVNLSGSTVMLGVFLEDTMVAAGWIFLFHNQHTVHTQYLCADARYDSLSPMTFLYYSVIEYAKVHDYRFVSWGISTENHGGVLNWGLTESKEHFGGSHAVHRSFRMSLD